MKEVIIAIHGLGNKPPKALLKKWWLKSIREGLNRIGKGRIKVPFEIVYWADVIYPAPLNPYIRNKENPLYLDERYRKAKRKIKKRDLSVADKFLMYVEEQLDKVFLNKDLSINFKYVTDKIITKYFKDLETYFGEKCVSQQEADCSARESIQKRLIQVIEKYENHKILLIAHSMGSIIAFDVLSKMSYDCVHTFVTIGSPLGLPIIVSRFFADQKIINKKIKFPHTPDSIYAKWYNMSDHSDKVALDHTLADDYLENNKGIKATDFAVFNDYENQIEENPHKSYGYLRTEEMANVIDEFISSRPIDEVFRKYKTFTKSFNSKILDVSRIINGGTDE